jgi:ArsR family transcriptional regulator
MNGSILGRISRRLKAISDPTRIKIIVMLSKKECRVWELTEALGLAQPTVSRHLKQLELEGFLSKRRRRNWVLYRLDPQEECCRRLLAIVVSRAEEDPDVRELLNRLIALEERVEEDSP